MEERFFYKINFPLTKTAVYQCFLQLKIKIFFRKNFNSFIYKKNRYLSNERNLSLVLYLFLFDKRFFT
ncbi:hypothetical protein D920_01440 [Enterococcus faecalis 13-SD-W-01]|nr:hypothetical protein D920_01440 [Enterococcus faecalis 13-SD-W-01]